MRRHRRYSLQFRSATTGFPGPGPDGEDIDAEIRKKRAERKIHDRLVWGHLSRDEQLKLYNDNLDSIRARVRRIIGRADVADKFVEQYGMDGVIRLFEVDEAGWKIRIERIVDETEEDGHHAYSGPPYKYERKTIRVNDSDITDGRRGWRNDYTATASSAGVIAGRIYTAIKPPDQDMTRKEFERRYGLHMPGLLDAYFLNRRCYGLTAYRCRLRAGHMAHTSTNEAVDELLRSGNKVTGFIDEIRAREYLRQLRQEGKEAILIAIQSNKPVPAEAIRADGTFSSLDFWPTDYNYVTWIDADTHCGPGCWEWMNHGLAGIDKGGPQRVSRSRTLPKVASLPYTYYLVVEFPDK